MHENMLSGILQFRKAKLLAGCFVPYVAVTEQKKQKNGPHTAKLRGPQRQHKTLLHWKDHFS